MSLPGLKKVAKLLELHKRTALLAGLCAAGGLIFLLTSSPSAALPEETPIPTVPPAPTSSPEATVPPDTRPPLISGAHDLTATVGASLSYRSGVTAVDETDGDVPLKIDASAVDLTQPGEYPVVYRARDKAGNLAEVTVTAVVTEPPEGESPEEVSAQPTQEQVDAEADKILARIIDDSMSQYEKARAIYNYVNSHVKYVGTSDKSSWLVGAYVGFTRGRGDCYNYFACSKALLTRAGIPNVDLTRVGGRTDHYWQLVNVGSGWYHFDTCPHPKGYPLTCFLVDEQTVRSYTEECTPVRTNYYVYDYDACPVVAEGFPVEEAPEESALPVEESLPPAEESRIPTEESLPPVEEPELPAGTAAPDPEEAVPPPDMTVTQPPAEQPGELLPSGEAQPAISEEPVPVPPPAELPPLLEVQAE